MTAGSSDVVEHLGNLHVGVFDAILVDNPDRVGSLLDDDPSLLEKTIGDERAGAGTHEADWQTPLAFAILRKRPSAVRLLLARGARVDLADVEGRRLMDIARDDSTAEIFELLTSASPL